MELEYGVDDIPPRKVLVTLSLQWLAIIAPILIIGSRVIAEIHYEAPAEKVVYIQKVFFISGVTMIFQLFFGHRLPLVVGPASVLIVGIYASLESGLSSIYTAITIGGILIFLFSITGLLGTLRKFFTEKVVAVILILVPITISPAIAEMILFPASVALGNIFFSILYTSMLFIFHKKFGGFWNTTLIIWALIFGSIFYFAIFPQQVEVSNSNVFGFFHDVNLTPVFKLEVIISFLFCFLALTINDISSIYSLSKMLEAEDVERRVKNGVSVTGLSNVLSGLLGVIGSVNYSMSPGIISATKCASRFPLIISGFALILISFIPIVISLIGAIPRVVIGSLFIYLLSVQVAVVFSMVKVKNLESGIVIAFPLILGSIVTFIPNLILEAFPKMLKPLFGNGFVVGVLTAILVEQLILKIRRFW